MSGFHTSTIVWSGPRCCRKVTVTSYRDGAVEAVIEIEVKHNTLLKVFERVLTFLAEHGSWSKEVAHQNDGLAAYAPGLLGEIAEELNPDVEWNESRPE